jgi:hypothetical protein
VRALPGPTLAWAYAMSNRAPFVAVAAVSLLTACSAATESARSGVDGPEPSDPGSAQLAEGATVQDAIQMSCSTTSVKGLSEQIVAQMNCLVPEALAPLPERANLEKGAATFGYMQPPARDALVAALDANPGKMLRVNSMLRTVAQQFVLSRWGQIKRCGVALAAKPGNSNHESGLALDTSEYSSWKVALTAEGFKWFGNADKVHFDFVGSGKENLKGKDVKAFQILWNRNHAEDVIDEDGAYGPATAGRLAKAPANGFPVGASCADTPAAPDPGCSCDADCANNGDCCEDPSVCG